MLSDDSISNIKGVGENREVKLNKLGIFSVKDLIEYFPRTYDDRSVITPISDLEADQTYTIRAKISSKPVLLPYNGKTIVKAKVKDESGECFVTWFNMPYMKNTLLLNSEYIFTGKIREKNNQTEMLAPDFDAVKDGRIILSNGRIVPVYSSTKGLPQKIIRNIIFNTLRDHKDLIYEFLPEYILKKYNLCGRKYAVCNIHFPESDDAFFKARERLVFEELFIMQIRLLMLRRTIDISDADYIFENTDTKPIEDLFPFEFTAAQKKVLNEIKEDISSGCPMNRLIQGDVGSGKTAVAAAAMFIAVNDDTQCALMAPTDVLAYQHYKTLSPIFEKLGMKCVYLASSVKGRRKKLVYEMIETGAADIIIGTHAIIQDKVKFRCLSLAVTDEQHRFGVLQRGRLTEKAKHPHILVMTATPIPRTLGLILYGDLYISVIDSLPPGRQKIDTFSVDDSYRQRLYNFIRKNIAEGRQAYIICAAIEENEKNNIKAVTEYTNKLKTEIFPDLRTEFVHGKLNSDEKQNIMDEFSEGKINILVATTVIEVGINVPNATLMIVENAERFGLSQLHQLRGRVGRGKEKSYCVLISGSKSKTAKKRLKILTSTQDGFEISEQDLNLRGPGDFFGTRQHGIPEFKIANLYKDIKILKTAQAAAENLLKDDPSISSDKNEKLKCELLKLGELYKANI